MIATRRWSTRWYAGEFDWWFAVSFKYLCLPMRSCATHAVKIFVQYFFGQFCPLSKSHNTLNCHHTSSSSEQNRRPSSFSIATNALPYFQRSRPRSSTESLAAHRQRTCESAARHPVHSLHRHMLLWDPLLAQCFLWLIRERRWGKMTSSISPTSRDPGHPAAEPPSQRVMIWLCPDLLARFP
jgi:hypothetical protein